MIATQRASRRLDRPSRWQPLLWLHAHESVSSITAPITAAVRAVRCCGGPAVAVWLAALPGVVSSFVRPLLAVSAGDVVSAVAAPTSGPYRRPCCGCTQISILIRRATAPPHSCGLLAAVAGLRCGGGFCCGCTVNQEEASIAALHTHRSRWATPCGGLCCVTTPTTVSAPRCSSEVD
jgi:hypothetical protein